MKASERWTTAAAAAVLLAAVAVALRWLWSGVFLAEFQADTADNLLWAMAQREASSLVNPTFHYGYFIPFGGNLLIRPFLPWLGDGVASIRAGMTLFVLLFAFAGWRLFRSFGWSRAAAALSVSLLFAVSFATLKMREIQFGHVLYYNLGTVLLFLGCALAPDPAGGDGGTRRARTLRAAAFALCLAWAAACGKPLLLYAVAPVLGAWVLARLGEDEPLSPLRDGARILPGVAGAAIGAAVFLLVSRKVSFSAGYVSFYEVYARASAWWTNAEALFLNWISLLDVPPSTDIRIASAGGVPHVARIATALLLGAAPAVALLRLRSFSARERMLLAAHWILAGAILLYWVFGNISSANWRLCPLVLSSAAVAACLVRDLVVRGTVPVRRFGACAALFLSGFVLLSSVQVCALPCEWKTWRGRKTLLSVLEALGIRDGYCSDYWYANATTAVSGGRFRLREVRGDGNGGWAPRLHNADARWYEPDPARTRTVFVCHPREASAVPQQGLVAHYRCSQKTGRLGYGEPLIVFVYDGDCLHPGTAPDEL